MRSAARADLRTRRPRRRWAAAQCPSRCARRPPPSRSRPSPPPAVPPSPPSFAVAAARVLPPLLPPRPPPPPLSPAAWPPSRRPPCEDGMEGSGAQPARAAPSPAAPPPPERRRFGGGRCSEVARALPPSGAERFRLRSPGRTERFRCGPKCPESFQASSEGARRVPRRQARASCRRPIAAQDAAEAAAARPEAIPDSSRARPNTAESPSGPARGVEESRVRSSLFRSRPKAGEAVARKAEMCRIFSERARIPFRRPERRLPNGHCPKPPESDRTGPSAPIAAEGREAGRHERPRRGGCRDAGGLVGGGGGGRHGGRAER